MVPIVRIRGIEAIPNADLIELAIVGDYRSVVIKGQFKTGDLAVYLPEASVLPDSLIETLGLVGKLAGAKKNRIKAVKLRGCLSQGILYGDVPQGCTEGDNVASVLGIEKFEPPIPFGMAGEVANLSGHTLNYDIENYKSFPDVLIDGEIVEFSEKLHGTFCCFSVIQGLSNPEMFEGNGLVYSKGLGSKGLVFKDNESNATNLYVQTAKQLNIHRRIRAVFPHETVHICGEIYGHKVQDLNYGRKDRGFAVFDINVDGQFLDRVTLKIALYQLGLDRVPVVYCGPFSRDVMYQHTDGRTIAGNNVHLREGIVVTPSIERSDISIGRVILKSVSGDYLTRKGETTEFA
jgi:RNA ligase (TIGR02306 family)